ncbi:hypothetical protein Bbelb_018960 [Branchiostoma belcheri]|nr:hypothetical protein Bbelb_018960 [Branchiostoma belcheri]
MSHKRTLLKTSAFLDRRPYRQVCNNAKEYRLVTQLRNGAGRNAGRMIPTCQSVGFRGQRQQAVLSWTGARPAKSGRSEAMSLLPQDNSNVEDIPLDQHSSDVLKDDPEELLQAAAKAKTWYMDGTFKLCRPPSDALRKQGGMRATSALAESSLTTPSTLGQIFLQATRRYFKSKKDR